VSIPVINSIVVGDVGSGKTAVAFSVAVGFLLGVESGTVVFMAPTEILAVQHYQSLLNYLSRVPDHTIDSICITRTNKLHNTTTLKPKALETLLGNITTKRIIIGTHALLHKELYADVILLDEQHRFGVAQRGKLSEQTKGLVPHYISFTATPIPRTLSLSVYRYLDTQRLDRLVSRSPITTKVVSIKSLPMIQTTVEKHLSTGKVYVIVPQIEQGEDEELMTVAKATKWLSGFVDEKHIIATHGKEKDKTAKLTEFKINPSIKICVATSVIEVGVDVKDATLIVILNAERFGLAALHQLRGRVGRNDRQDNECLLCTSYPLKKLDKLASTQDGFEIAQYDLETRGGGSMLGKNQSGFDSTTELLLSLPTEYYEKLTSVVEELNFEDTKFARLKSYVQKRVEESWTE
jgi:ATP-dependent DNA helicase RecG